MLGVPLELLFIFVIIWEFRKLGVPKFGVLPSVQKPEELSALLFALSLCECSAQV